MKSARLKRHHVFIIPIGLFATRPHADPRRSVPAHEVDGNLAQDRKVASYRPVIDATVILPERDIKHPMQ